jgi:hypothetical protein
MAVQVNLINLFAVLDDQAQLSDVDPFGVVVTGMRPGRHPQFKFKSQKSDSLTQHLGMFENSYSNN